MLTAYSPLGRGELPDGSILTRIAGRHSANLARVALAWLPRQEGVAAILKMPREASQKLELGTVPLAARLDVTA